MRILIIEDNPDIAANIGDYLDEKGHTVDFAGDGITGLHLAIVNDFDAIVLDLALPGMDGLTVLKRWREAGQTFPVLVLTARGSWNERVAGIDAGADDYLPKPFQVEELLARLRAILRRTTGQTNPLISVGALTLDTRQMRVTVNGLPVHLAPQEYRLVSYLLQHAGRVVTQLELTEQLYSQDFERASNAVEVLVGRVRKKLGVDVIETRRGFGYIIEKPE